MKLMQRIAVGVGCTLLVMLSIDLAAPRVVHAVAAALVQVTNTTSNPVPTLDASYAQLFNGNCSNTGIKINEFDCFISVPAGKRLIIQNVSMNTQANANAVVAQEDFVPDNSSIVWLPLTPSDSNGAVRENSVNQEVHAYADSQVACEVLYDGTPFSFQDFSCSVYGYLVEKP